MRLTPVGVLVLLAVFGCGSDQGPTEPFDGFLQPDGSRVFAIQTGSSVYSVDTGGPLGSEITTDFIQYRFVNRSARSLVFGGLWQCDSVEPWSFMLQRLEEGEWVDWVQTHRITAAAEDSHQPTILAPADECSSTTFVVASQYFGQREISAGTYRLVHTAVFWEGSGSSSGSLVPLRYRVSNPFELRSSP